jgi:chromosome segregation ATPase
MLEAFKKIGSPGVTPVQEQVDELQALISTSREERGALSAILTHIEVYASNVQERVGELQELISAAREERAALSTVLSQIETHASKLSQVGNSLQQVNERATGVTVKLEEVTTRLVALESRTTGFEQIETRIRSLVDSVAQAEQTADTLLKPEGELQRHRQAVQQLSSQVIQTTASLEELRKEQAAVDQLHDRVSQAQTELKGSVERTAALKNEFDQLRWIATQLQEGHNQIWDALRLTRDNANAMTEAVRDMEKKLGPLAQLNELSKTTEERLATLNSLGEHVLQKVKVLENQKHTVEHALIESHRLTEMVRNMDVQIAKLDESAKQVAQADETAGRIEKVAREMTAQFERAEKERDEFGQELAKLERDRAQLSDFVRSHTERLALERKQFEAFDQRVEAQLSEMVRNMDAQIAKLDEGAKQVAQADETAGRIEKVASEMTAQFEQAKKERDEFGQELAKLGKDRAQLSDFVRSHAERLALERKQFEAFDERVEAQLSEMVRNMDAQIAKLDEGAKQVAQADETAGRIEKVASEMTAQFEQAKKERDEFGQELAKLGKDRAQLSDFVRSLTDRLALERKQFEAFAQRVQALQTNLAGLEKNVEGLTGKDRIVTSMSERVEGLSRQVTTLIAQADELQDDNIRVEELRHIGELDSPMDAITAKLLVVEESARQVETLVTFADDLQRQMTRIAGRQEFVERDDARVNGLLSISADKELEQGLGRWAELEALKSVGDGLGRQISDVWRELDAVSGLEQEPLPLTTPVVTLTSQADIQQKLAAVSGLQQKLLLLMTQAATLKSQIHKTAAACQAAQQEQAQIAAQQRRLAELKDASSAMAAAVDERLRRVQSRTAEPGRGSSLKEQPLQELARLQRRQRDMARHMEAAEDRLKLVDDHLKQFDQRQVQLVVAEKKISAFETRLGELRTIAEEVERALRAIAAREAFVATVKKEVDEAYEMSARSRADVEQVAEHRSEIDALPQRVGEALESVAETEQHVGVVEARQKLVDEVQLKTSIIVNMLEDLRFSLEKLGEPKAVIGHVVESMARLNNITQGAQAALKVLQTERELAERIARKMKQLRARTASGSADESKRLA